MLLPFLLLHVIELGTTAAAMLERIGRGLRSDILASIEAMSPYPHLWVAGCPLFSYNI